MATAPRQRSADLHTRIREEATGQVGLVAPDQGLRAAAGAAQSQLMRDVVAAGALPASAIAQAGPP